MKKLVKKVIKSLKWFVGVIFRTATNPKINEKRDEVTGNDSSYFDKRRGGF